MKHYPFIFISDIPRGKISQKYHCFKWTQTRKAGITYKKKDIEPYSYLLDNSGQIVWIFRGTKEVRPSNQILVEIVNQYI